MTIKINGTPIESLTPLPYVEGNELIPTGRTWALCNISKAD